MLGLVAVDNDPQRVVSADVGITQFYPASMDQGRRMGRHRLMQERRDSR